MRTKVAAFLALVGLLLAVPASAAPVGQDDRQVKAVAGPILDNLLAGFSQGDYAQYSRDFDGTLKAAISEQKFQRVREELLEKLGKIQSKKYLGFLDQRPNTVVLWKATFDGTQSDVLIKLALVKQQDKVMVAGLWFQ